MNRNGLKIGEFSRLCLVTVRALRHYEKIRLLVPEIIDYSTGYRYYSVRQMQKALNIVRLKGLGFSLEEKIRTCQEQLQLLTECWEQLSGIGSRSYMYEGLWPIREDPEKWLTIIQVPVTE